MKLSLKDRDWGVFFLDDLFDIYSTSSSIDRNKLNAKSGRFPYITRTDKNNGYDDFVQIQAEKYKIDKANVITVGLDWIIRSIPTHFPELNPGFKKKAFSL